MEKITQNEQKLSFLLMENCNELVLMIDWNKKNKVINDLGEGREWMFY